MYHYVSRARSGLVLFRTWTEGLRLFAAIRDAFPELVALCVMPDHIHLLLAHDEGGPRLAALMSGHARYLRQSRGSGGHSYWEPAPPPERVEADKVGRNIRYIHLNPCRKRIVADPLSWPLSTHLDFVALSADPRSLRHARPESFHAYVSGDPTVAVGGTALPEVQYNRFDCLAIRDAVSAVSRSVIGARLTPMERALLVRTAAAHRLFEPGAVGVSAFAEVFDMSRSQVHRLAAAAPTRNVSIRDPALAAAVRVVGDGRFAPLTPGDLLRRPGWEPYRNRR